MCLSPFKEGQSQMIELLGDYTDAVDCMIRYLYTLDYEPEVIFGLNGRSAIVEIINKADTEVEIGDHRTPVEDIPPPLDSEVGDAQAGDLGSLLSGADEVEDRVFEELRLHCQVYALAEKYAIKALMVLSREKFQSALEKVDVNTRLFQVVEDIYSSTPDSDRGLRDIVVSKVYSEIQYWLRQTEFHRALAGTSSFCVDLLKETVYEDQKRYEQAIADVHHPGYCGTCQATLVVRRTVSRRASTEVPWLFRVTRTKIHFQRAMSKLHDHSLVDVVAGSYQVNTCLHDWLKESLPQPVDKSLFIAAVLCVASLISDKSNVHYWTECRRLLDHIEQLESPNLLETWRIHISEGKVFDAADRIAGLESDMDRHTKARSIDQDKLDEAGKMLKRALAGYEKAIGPDHTSTLDTVHSLGNLYRDQDKLDEAEQMYLRALAGKEKALGPNHTSTLTTVNNLGILYTDQGKLDEAEQMYLRALAGKEKALGPDHTSTLTTVNNLGVLYRAQGKLDEADQMHLRARPRTQLRVE
ncbi:hypothetical protein LTR92_011314 [Exophiala xenobiotica]|nr:hypothetical protein LTR92_011314 [Exophiala xenobiotica]KAK5332315.1 hypothetical protein LTR98_011553 [Exophiala xenobiotica]